MEHHSILPSYLLREQRLFAIWLTVTGLGIFVDIDTPSGLTLCTVPNAHPNFLHDFRVCSCEPCHLRRIKVYQLSAWSVAPEARAYARLRLSEED